jgi:hypothetical protein
MKVRFIQGRQVSLHHGAPARARVTLAHPPWSTHFTARPVYVIRQHSYGKKQLARSHCSLLKLKPCGLHGSP